MNVFDILAAFFAAALAALGVGGGGILVIYLVLVLNMEQHAAQGVNLIFFIAASLAALPFHIARRRVRLLPVLIFSVFGVPGACLGCLAAVLNMEQHAAQGVNLIFFIAASLAALPFHIARRRVRLLPVLIFSVFGVPGACLGCLAAARLSSDTVRLAFGIMLTAAGGLTLYKTIKGYMTKKKSGGRLNGNG